MNFVLLFLENFRRNYSCWPMYFTKSFKSDLQLRCPSW